jgi:uncharacterized membrane protein HdeD (DUF308 family)
MSQDGASRTGRGEGRNMSEALLRSWRVYMLRGVVSVLFGVLALAVPGLTLLWLVALFAAYALITGAVSVYGALRNRKRDDWLLPLLLGLVGIAAGIIAVVHPELTALVLVLLMGANALVTGVLDIAMAIRLRKVVESEWMLVLAGIVSIVFGVLVFLFPGAGALALVWLISFYAVLSGVLFLTVGFRARSAARARLGAAPRHPEGQHGLQH